METEFGYPLKERMAFQPGNAEIEGITIDNSFLLMDHAVRVVNAEPNEKAGKGWSDMDRDADSSPAIDESVDGLDFLRRVRLKRS